MAKTPVLIDTDVDIDDWMAILYLLLHPEVDVLGVTVTGAGASHLSFGVKNALGLVALAGKPDTPVAAGAKAPLLYSNVFSASIRGPIDATYNVPLPVNPNPAVSESATDFLVKTLTSCSEPVTILAIGGGTNLGTLLRDHPEVVPKIRHVVMMGGAIKVPGNVNVVDADYSNTVAEWNFFIDPLGAKLLFDSGVAITLVPLDASDLVPINLPFYDRLQQRHVTPAAAFIYQVMTADIAFVQSGNFFAWDPLAAAILTDESIGRFTDLKLSIVQELDEENDHSAQLVETADGAKVRTALWADADRFYDRWLTVINGAYGEVSSRAFSEGPGRAERQIVP
jgi:inosine-uridine nucleoside N-ribohydrolase